MLQQTRVAAVIPYYQRFLDRFPNIGALRSAEEDGNVGSTVVRARLRAVADSVIDPRHPGEFNQGLMELGATVCLPKQPQCLLCPLARDCRARQSSRQSELPVKSARPGPTEVEIQLLVIEKEGKILAWKRPADSRRLAGFWELPEPAQLPRARIKSKIAEFRHTIVNTNYSYHVFRASLLHVPTMFHWLSKKELHEFPLS